MVKYKVLAPLLVGLSSYTAAFQDEEGRIWSGKLNLDTWCQTPKSYRKERSVYPTMIKSKLKPLTDIELSVLDQEHPNFKYNFVWGSDE